MTLKQNIYFEYLKLINSKIEMHKSQLEDLKQMAALETKSTAGDKHETALAMLQIEQAHQGKLLSDSLEQKAFFEFIDPLVISETVTNGSLILTANGYFFISLALGKLIVNENKIVSLSLNSPLGQCFKAKKKGESIIMNNIVHDILDLL